MSMVQKVEVSDDSELKRFDILRRPSTKLHKLVFEPIVGPVNEPLAKTQNQSNRMSFFPVHSVFSRTNHIKNCDPCLDSQTDKVPLKKVPCPHLPMNNFAFRTDCLPVHMSPVYVKGETKFLIKENLTPKTTKSGIISRDGVVKKSSDFSLTTSKTKINALKIANKASGFGPAKWRQLTPMRMSEESLVRSLSPVRNDNGQALLSIDSSPSRNRTLETLSAKNPKNSLSFQHVNESIIEGDTAAFCLNLKSLRLKKPNAPNKHGLIQSEDFDDITERRGVRTTKTLTTKQ